MKNFTHFTLRSLLVAGLLAGFGLAGCSPATESTQASANQQAKVEAQLPIVETTYGTISGDVEDGVYSFKGIRYAKAERFMPPQEPDSWEGVREHTEFGPIAPQVNAWSPEEAMNEEELFSLNVWTQGLNDGKKRPVMFWLHGGGFAVGASDDPL